MSSYGLRSTSYRQPSQVQLHVRIHFFEYQLPVVVWLLLIFFLSTDAFSTLETSKFIVPALRYAFPGLSYEQIQFWHVVIRKLAHMTEYAILAALAYRCLKNGQIDLADSRIKTIGFVLMAALMDEWHQRFTALRGASIVDVGYDCLGGVWALGVIGLYETWRLRSHSIL